MSSNYDRIYAVVREVPAGKVATYGQVAALAGLAGHARQVGYALHRVPDGENIPWHRVLNARGEISERSNPGSSEALQRVLLEQEGVSFRPTGRVDLAVYRWEPDR